MRRVVTGHDAAGKSLIVSDGEVPRFHEYAAFPGFGSGLVWATPAGRPVIADGADPTAEVASFVPPLGETRLISIVLPPDAHMGLPTFDGPAFGAEQMEHGPGLAERFEADGMHTTPTADYAIVISGKVCIEMDDGSLTELSAGDVLVQNGTRHGWRNRSDAPATLLAVLIGAGADA